MIDTQTEIEALARSTGATSIANGAIRDLAQQQFLCKRLYAHVRETMRALGRSDAELAVRVNAALIAREMIQMSIESRERSDRDREQFERWVTAERTKFLMSTKVDMLIALHERMLAANDTTSRRAHQVVETTVQDLVTDVLASFAARVRRELRRVVAVSMRQLVAELGTAFTDLHEDISLDFVAGADVVPENVGRVSVGAHAPGLVASVAGRFGFVRRGRMELAAREAILERCDLGTRRIAVRALEDFDELRGTCDDRLCELVDGIVASVRYAATFAVRSRGAGDDQVIRDRVTLAETLASITQMNRRLYVLSKEMT